MRRAGWNMPDRCPHGVTPDTLPTKPPTQPPRQQTLPDTTPPDTPRPNTTPPAWVRAVAALRQPGDAGVGDTIHRIAKSAPDTLVGLGIALKRWMTGSRDCGCERDRRRLNQIYPY